MKKKHLYTAVILLSLLAIGIQPTLAFYSIPSDTSIGTLDGRTYTLDTDVTGTIQIDESNLTLNGNGKTITPIVGENTDGIFASLKTEITIMNVTIEKNVDGLGFDTGIKILQSTNITITDNNISGCDVSSEWSSGIYLNLTYASNLSNNDVSNNSIGIQLSGSYSDVTVGNTLTNNNVTNNDWYAIYLHNSTYNTLTLNSISGNYRGLRILSGSDENLIYNNNFINTYGLHASVTDSINNVFSYNYWDDYTGDDSDGDGIGDTPYIIDMPYPYPDFQDDFPWVNPGGPPPPPTPQDEIVELIFTVEEMNLQQGIDNSLDAKLDTAFNALDDINENNDVAAINSLNAFINAVEAQRDNKITDEQATILIGKANDIINML